MLSKRPDGVADPSPDGSSPSERPTWRRRDVTRDAEVAEVGDDVASFNLCHFQHLSCFKSNSGSNIWILGSSVSSHLHFFARPKRMAYSHLSVRRKKRLQVAKFLSNSNGSKGFYSAFELIRFSFHFLSKQHNIRGTAHTVARL